MELADAVALRRELLVSGYNDKAIATARKRGELVRVRHGAYCAGDLWRELGPQDRHRVRARALLRSSHPTTVLSHVSAALEHGAPVWGMSLDDLHVTRTDGHPRRRESGVIHHSGVLPASEVTVVNGVPVTVPLRTSLEVCTQTDVESALVSVDALLRMANATSEDVKALKEQGRHWPKSLSAEIVYRLADPRRESAAESRTYFMCWRWGLPLPEPQVPVRDETGREFAFTDFAWPRLGVFLEFDGRLKYERFRRPGETLDEYVMREKRREERICAATGWVCLRIGWHDLDNPEATAARIRRLLSSRSGWTGMGA